MTTVIGLVNRRDKTGALRRALEFYFKT